MRFTLTAVTFAAVLSAAPMTAVAQAIVATVPGAGGEAAALNASTNRVYFATGYGNGVSVIDGATHAASTIPVGYRPQFIEVNVATNRIYTSNTQDGTLSVIDGATRAVISLPIGGAGPIAINERTNKIYVMRRGNNREVTVVDGATNTWYSINTGSYVPEWMVVNPANNTLYVSHSTSGDVRAIDTVSTSDHPSTVSIQVAGRPTHLALNEATNKVYVLSDDARGPIVAIDGSTNTTQRFTTPGHSGIPQSIAVNSATNRVYAAMGAEVVVLDANTGAMSYIPAGYLYRLVVDRSQNRIYGVDGSGAVVAIDGATHTFTRIAMPTQVLTIAVNPATHRVYAAGGATYVIDGTAPPVPPPLYGTNLQGLWWNWPEGSESGWGINVAHQGNTLFATWFTYDTDGGAMWLVAPNMQRSGDSYTGDVYRTTGPALGTTRFDPNAVARVLVGNVSLTTVGSDALLFSGTVYGSRLYKTLTRQVFASPVPTCEAGGSAGARPNYQDIWWAAPAGVESGWGVYLTHQGDNLFVTWFTYGADGKALWMVASNVVRTGPSTFSGTLYRTWGPPFNALPWLPSQVSVMPVGSVTLAFSDAASGTFSYTAMGISGSKSITRQVFSTPPSVCR